MHYEIVLFSSMVASEAHSIMETIDPINAVVVYRLYRDSTTYENGNYLKDMSLLNRDLSKVIYVDHDDLCVEKNKENALKVRPWNGNPKDSLANYIDFFESRSFLIS
jgi:import inner membrane translocase subunit TIM50